MATEPTPETGTTTPAASRASPPAATPAPVAETPEAIALPHATAAATDAAQSVPMTPPEEDALPWLDKVDWVLLGLLVVLSFLAASVPAYNTDVWMNLATGRLIAQGNYLPGGAEPFSCATVAANGRDAVPWINHSWLYSLGMYLLYVTAGGMGVAIAKASLIALLTIVLMLIRANHTHRLLVALCLTLTVLAMAIRLPLQPIIVSYLFLGITLLLLHRAGAFDTAVTVPNATSQAAKWLWGLPILCLLWVNLDNWFVLGPITVALCWAGVALARWRGPASPVAPGRLGLVLGACIVACVINPFHVRAFQLPPELAFLLVRGGDAIGVNLPDAIAGGGRSLAILHENTPNVQPTMQAISPDYLRNPELGFTIAGICFFPLLGLSLLSFIANGLLGGRPGAPGLNPARFLVWLFFAALAVLLYRMVPFFAIVAGPITALNLSDLLAWYARPTADGIPETPWVAPVRLARVLGVFMLLALGLLAWPGWLIGKWDIDSRNHVAWQLPVDVSLQKAAEELGAIYQREKAGRGDGGSLHVFSTGQNLSCYCAWFAPGVKGFFDTRFNLFPQATGDWLTARQAFADRKRPQSEWSTVLHQYDIEFVAVESFLTIPGSAQAKWSDPARWLQEFADRNVAVFRWSGDQPHWPSDAVMTSWNRLAFGAVPLADRPPAKGLPNPAENRPLLDRYRDPPPTLPQTAFDMDVKKAYGQFCHDTALSVAGATLPRRAPLQVQPAQVLPMYSVMSAPVSPGAFRGPWALLATVGPMLIVNEVRFQTPFWAEVDLFPPAVPVLMIRRGWQTVAAVPEYERCYVYLANAFAKMQDQEEHWIDAPAFFRRAQPPNTLRSLLRRTQLLAALRSATEIGFSDPMIQHQVHRDLAELYLAQQSLDMAATHYQEAEKAWDDAQTALQPTDPRAQEMWRDRWNKAKKELGDRRKALDDEVERRNRDFKLRTATRKPFDRIREAVSGVYVRVNKDNKQEVLGSWGLTDMALQLIDTNFDALSEPERLACGQLSLDLLFKTGRIREASDLLDKLEGALGPRALIYQVYRAGALGNYDELRKALKEYDRLTGERARAIDRVALLGSVTRLAPAGSPTACLSLACLTFNWGNALTVWGLSVEEHANGKTLLGIIALEAGATAEAQRHFDDALRESSGVYFSERPIAERYAELLKAYQKP